MTTTNNKQFKEGVDHPLAKNSSVQIFREYLRIPSVHPNVDYTECVNFLKKHAKELNFPVRIYEMVPNKPILIMTWTGLEPNLPALMLNSHMDVVPVFEENWTYAPFAADMDAQGNIFARGSQDMKCVGIQYLEAIRRLRKAGVTFRRTIYLSFVPDEEVGGKEGMEMFVRTPEFRALNVGFSLDEGYASPTGEYSLFYGERAIWHVLIRCTGTPGHGSLMLNDTAGEKINYIIDKFMKFRAQEKTRLESNPNFTVGDVTTVNLTRLLGGVQNNVVPPELAVSFDVRLNINENEKDFEAIIRKWCQEAGTGVTLEFEQKNKLVPVTKLDSTNPWWLAFKQTADQLNIKLKPLIFPGGTDSRYVREVGLPALGFSPMINTPVLLHDNDEFLNADVFLKGIDIYEKIIPALANLEDRSG